MRPWLILLAMVFIFLVGVAATAALYWSIDCHMAPSRPETPITNQSEAEGR